MRYNRNTNQWSKISSISSSDIVSHGMFGHSLDINGNRAIIGSRDGNIAIDYLFDESSLNWIENHTFSPLKLQSDGRFGYSVSLLEDKVFIGYPGYNQEGEVHVYSLKENTWKNEQIIKVDSTPEKSYFGASVDAKGGSLAIGNFNGENVNIFKFENGAYINSQSLAPQNLPGSKFGRSLFLGDDKLVVGATYGQLAYVFDKANNHNWSIKEILQLTKKQKYN